MNSRVRVSFVLIASILFYSAAAADEGPTWQEYGIKSANGKYSVSVINTEKESGGYPWENIFRISVYDISEPKIELWSCDFDYNGYPGGLLSDDASTFVYVDYWYYADSPAVFIYRNGSKVGSLAGGAFNILADKLISTASHQLWLKDDGRCLFKQEPGKPLLLELTTIDGVKHVIDTTTAKLSN
jgi:hypothetical protein